MINQGLRLEKPNKIETEKDPTIKLIGSSQAPEKYKKNPFYNDYHWGMADWEEKKLFLPDNSDEAISFSIASHELGHLVNRGRIQPDRENFNDTYQEELRAWEVGWNYLEKHLADYYNTPESIQDLKDIEEKVKGKMVDITLLTEPFYQNLEKKGIKEQRETFLQTDQGQHIKAEIDGLKGFVEETLANSGKEAFLKKTDWSCFSNVIKKALVDIEKDNKSDVQFNKESNPDFHNEDHIRHILAGENKRDIESLAVYYHFTPDEVRLFSYFAKLRQKTLDEMRPQIEARRQNHPIATEDELNMGAYQESIEPQVRPAVFDLRKKGYATYGSGFSGFDSQEIYFEKEYLKNFQLPAQMVNEFKNRGVIIEIKADRIKLIFKKEFDQEEIKALWQEVESCLPDLREPSPPCQLRQATSFRERQKCLTIKE